MSQAQHDFAAVHRLSIEEYRKLVTLPLNEIYICLILLRCKKHRSSFRARMERKIRSWLATDSVSSKPLTDLEFKYAAPKFPINIVLPTKD